MGLFQKKFAQKTTKIIINGKQYDSLADVPSQFRTFFEDKDGDGCPDWVQNNMASMQGFASANSLEMTTVNGVTTYKVDDRQYNSLDEMPEEHRALFEDRDGDGLPDAFPKIPGFSGAGSPRQTRGMIGVSDDKRQQAPTQQRQAGEGWGRRSSVPPDLQFVDESAGGGVLLAVLFVLLTLLVAGLAFLAGRLL